MMVDMLLHSDRYSTTGVSTRKRIVVIHDSESGDGSALSLVAALSRPGDRAIAGTTRKYGSGYHAVTDGTGGYIAMADATAGPFAAPPLNKSAWHICMPGRAAQTRDEWLDDLSRNHILGVARFIVTRSVIDDFPLDKLTPAQLLAGDSGYCSHWDVSVTWGQTDHTDPGRNFPWDVLADDIALLAAPPIVPPDPPDEEDEDMANSAFIAVEGAAGQYLWTPGSDPIPFTSPADRDAILKALKIKPEDGATISAEMFARLR